jgi:hypothetical protein
MQSNHRANPRHPLGTASNLRRSRDKEMSAAALELIPESGNGGQGHGVRGLVCRRMPESIHQLLPELVVEYKTEVVETLACIR